MSKIGSTALVALTQTMIDAIEAKRASAAGVHFYAEGAGPKEGDVVPLIITAEHEDGTVSGHAFLNAEGIMFLAGVTPQASDEGTKAS